MKYIALLRGINIGHKRIKMAHLKELFESLNFKNVRTYLQSGNIIFNHGSTDTAKITSEIEKKIIQTFKFQVNVILRTENEFETIINNNPFVKDVDIELDKLNVTFLQELPDKENIFNLSLNKDENEKFKVNGSEIYLYLPNGYARTGLTNNIFEKKLKTIATTRNWKTTNKLLELSKMENN